MQKKTPLFLILITILVIVFLGAYYFMYVKNPSTDTGWKPPEGNPPTKQMGVSITVPKGWRGPTPNSSVTPQ